MNRLVRLGHLYVEERVSEKFWLVFVKGTSVILSRRIVMQFILGLVLWMNYSMDVLVTMVICDCSILDLWILRDD